jgi:hypothetical protein
MKRTRRSFCLCVPGRQRLDLSYRWSTKGNETVENVTVPDDPLDIASMTREERDRLKRKLVAANPEAARQLGLTIAS